MQLLQYCKGGVLRHTAHLRRSEPRVYAVEEVLEDPAPDPQDGSHPVQADFLLAVAHDERHVEQADSTGRRRMRSARLFSLVADRVKNLMSLSVAVASTAYSSFRTPEGFLKVFRQLKDERSQY